MKVGDLTRWHREGDVGNIGIIIDFYPKRNGRQYPIVFWVRYGVQRVDRYDIDYLEILSESRNPC